jgi:hypothetical protein
MNTKINKTQHPSTQKSHSLSDKHVANTENLKKNEKNRQSRKTQLNKEPEL